MFADVQTYFDNSYIVRHMKFEIISNSKKRLLKLCKPIKGLFLNINILALFVITVNFSNNTMALTSSKYDYSFESESVALLKAEFRRDVEPLLIVPQDEIVNYALLLQTTLDVGQVKTESLQFILLIDRNPKVQVALLYWGSEGVGWQIVGATSVSTGLPGRYEHFVTPLGIFEHSTSNPDFRANGTKNKLGFRGYGLKGMRIYDFGWVAAPRTWDNSGMGKLRLQMHATDPDLAEPYLGSIRSEGCVRISAKLNDFIDRNGLLDQDYDKAEEETHLWVLRVDRTPTSTPGRFMVVVDSERKKRPNWSLNVARF